MPTTPLPTTFHPSHKKKKQQVRHRSGQSLESGVKWEIRTRGLKKKALMSSRRSGANLFLCPAFLQCLHLAVGRSAVSRVQTSERGAKEYRGCLVNIPSRRECFACEGRR
ncbi:unnamed protein product [Sphacelaria rigidula]